MHASPSFIQSPFQEMHRPWKLLWCHNWKDLWKGSLYKKRVYLPMPTLVKCSTIV